MVAQRCAQLVHCQVGERYMVMVQMEMVDPLLNLLVLHFDLQQRATLQATKVK
ncbi:hypothetical protein Tco_0296841, partial [Tanacetum coccineum]